jgi:hypothetical protein
MVRAARAARALALAALLFAPYALAQESRADVKDDRGGIGRVGVATGWRWTPNPAFIAQARQRGVSVSQSPGGPWLNGSFGYAPDKLFELAIELFAGVERIAVTGSQPITSVTYGGAFAGRVRASFGAGLLADEWVPSAGLLGGWTLVNASGGPFGSTAEAASFAWAASLAVAGRFGGMWATLEARYLLPVYAPVALSSGAGGLVAVDGGGVWVGIGLSWNVLGGMHGEHGSELGLCRPSAIR